jgi:hypothetical protein
MLDIQVRPMQECPARADSGNRAHAQEMQNPSGKIIEVLGYPDEPGIEYKIVYHSSPAGIQR